MFSTGTPKKAHSFLVYLSLSYFAVYAVCAVVLYHINTRVTSASARAFDRDDIKSESLEYAEMLRKNSAGNWLAEEVSIENFPPSTLSAIRLLTPDGHVINAASQPKDFAFPGSWDKTQATGAHAYQKKSGWREIYLPAYKRHLQLESTELPDGRILEVAKSTAREHAQDGILLRTSLAFFLLASFFTLGNGLWMMAIALRPIRQISADMSKLIEGGACVTGTTPVNSRISELNTLGRFFELLVRKNATLITAMKDTLDNVAHDFRTPLTRIRSAAEFAINTREPPISREELLRTLADIIDDCDTARIQLQNLLDIRAMESGFVKLDDQRFDLKRTVSEVANLYTVMAEEKNIDLRTELPEHDVPIDGDPAQLSQAIANIIDNAVKYTPREGHILITLEARQEHVLFTVADNGIGIPEDEHALVWQRLYRSRGARAEKGLGLGMSIVKAIVDAHGGTVTFTSAPGQGTTFVLTLPTRRPIQPVASDIRATPTRSGT